MEQGIQEIELPGGEIVLARIGAPAQADEEVPEVEDIGAFDALTHRVEQLNEVISGVGTAVAEAARAARPDEVSATFGIELMLQPGKAVALLADGQAKAAVSVTLTWRPGASAKAETTGGEGSTVRQAQG